MILMSNLMLLPEPKVPPSNTKSDAAQRFDQT
jgi:hypothetical protein